VPQGYAAPSQQSAAPAPAQTGYALPPPPPSNGGGFFAALFGHSWNGPSTYQPAAPDYQAQPQGGMPPGNTPSSQGDMSGNQVDPKYDRQTVDHRGDEKPGTIVIDTPNKYLYLVEDGGKAMRYGIGVGRPGFTWAGVKTITAKKEWPDWRPPTDMLQRRPASTIRSARARCISARRSTASMARTSPGPSAPMCRRAASACATRMSKISMAACRSAPKWW
jgi:lipoprotein-anchoring transpeptidase ErfK/SrfK